MSLVAVAGLLLTAEEFPVPATYENIIPDAAVARAAKTDGSAFLPPDAVRRSNHRDDAPCSQKPAPDVVGSRRRRR